MATKKQQWTREQLVLAFDLYCQTPFGKMYSKNPTIVQLANVVGRTPSAVAMKLVNFASLDPQITASGRAGLGNASAADKRIWDEFHADWERLALEAELLRRNLGLPTAPDQDADIGIPITDNFLGETRSALVEQRIKQGFFRRAVLSSYRGKCCMSGLSEPSLLVASHIVPWSADKFNRLNPSNGLCLSVLHDKAFDRGLIAVSEDLKIIVSEIGRAHV